MPDQTIEKKRSAEAAETRPHDSIVSPVADFMLVGGVSLFIIPFVMLPYWSAGDNSRTLYFAAYCLIFVLNLPHFVHGYQLLYPGFLSKITGPAYSLGNKIRHFIAGIAAPAFLIGFLLYGVLAPDTKMLGYATNLMLFTLGWHYVKQGYGIMIALSVRKKVFFDDFEKKILLANAYITWLFSWFVLNIGREYETFHGVPFSTIGLPGQWHDPVSTAYLAWALFTVFILFRKFDRHPTLCVNGLAAYFFSVYPWVLFAYSHPHIIIFVPALHALQYMLCVWKLVYERTKDELAQAGRAAAELTNKMVLKKMVPFLAVGFGAGAAIFIALPLWLDNVVPYDKDLFGPSLFVYCFLIFMNVHHYFIDFAIWRKDNPEMKYLFK